MLEITVPVDAVNEHKEELDEEIEKISVEITEEEYFFVKTNLKYQYANSKIYS